MAEKYGGRRGAGGNVRVLQGSAAWTYVIQSEGEERERRIAELVSSMSLEDKVGQMSGSAGYKDMPLMLIRYNLYPFKSGANRRLGIPAIKFTDGPRGVALGRSTCFPVSIARGATWDTDLEERIASAMGVEARSLGANFFAGVCLNLLRHPGWGRAQETFGEDPHHLGEMASAMVRGLERHVMSCVKHFACNSIEDSRFYVNVRIEERTLREVYLPHFRKCVEAGAAAVMSAYNRVNGEYCAHNRHLLRDILKGEWGFKGMVVSDFVYGTRNTVKAALGGLDIEMPNSRFFGRRLVRAVRRGEVPEAVIDEAVTRILRRKAEYAAAYANRRGYSKLRVACREHVDLAYEAACKGMVLLKNEDGALPLRKEQVARLAVFGDLASKANLGDRGSSRVRPPYAVTPLQGIRKRAGASTKVVYDKGDDPSRAAKLAAGADAAVVVVGLTCREEGESMPGISRYGGDRNRLGLPPRQAALIQAVSGSNKRCVVVLEGGSAVIMDPWKDTVQAILVVWYPGMEGGNALAAILFGEENPSGKLPITFPASPEQLPPFDNKAKEVEYGYFHGYRLFVKEGMEPAFPFGFGLSYSRYVYANLVLDPREISEGGTLKASLEVANVGDMAGREVVQVYVGYPQSGVERPTRELKGFRSVRLEPGETSTVGLEIKVADLAYYDVSLERWVVEEGEYTLYVGSSSREEDLFLRDTFRITTA